jgi:hypothetical protein
MSIVERVKLYRAVLIPQLPLLGTEKKKDSLTEVSE